MFILPYSEIAQQQFSKIIWIHKLFTVIINEECTKVVKIEQRKFKKYYVYIQIITSDH